MSKARVFIYGSCVSRDTFDFLHADEFELVQYIARQSAISAYTKSVELIDPPALPSPFQQRVLSDDFRSSLRTTIPNLRDIDLVLMDLTDERLGVYVLPDGSVVTRSIELIESGFERNLPAGSHYIPFGTDLHFQYWSAGISEISKLFSEHLPRTAIALLAVPWAERSESGARTPESFGVNARDMNPVMDAYTTHAAQALNSHLISIDPAEALSADDHRWGPAPFHYSTSVYRSLVHSLTGKPAPEFPQKPIEPGSNDVPFAPSGMVAPVPGQRDPHLAMAARIEDPAATTIVVLENAKKITDEWRLSYPIKQLGFNYVRICDPTLTENPELKFGWGIGGQGGPGLPRILDAVSRLDLAGDVAFAGTGAMGYVALRCGIATGFPVLTHNPDLLWQSSGTKSAHRAVELAKANGLHDQFPILGELPVPDSPIQLLATVNAAAPTATVRILPGLIKLLNDERRMDQHRSSLNLFGNSKNKYAPWTHAQFTDLASKLNFG